MRGTIQRMISNGSLAAFSASASNGAVSGPPPIRQPDLVNARAQAPQTGRTQSTSPPSGNLPAPPAPGQIVPRGSLLNLTV